MGTSRTPSCAGNVPLIFGILVTCLGLIDCQDFTQTLAQTDDSQIGYSVTVTTAPATVKRGNTITFTGLQAGTLNLVDDNVMANTSGSSGLTPGKAYSYTLVEGGTPGTAVTMCTNPLPPSSVSATAIAQDAVTLYFSVNPGNGDALNGFKFYESGAATTPTSVAAGETSVNITGLTSFSNYTFEVEQQFTCGANTLVSPNTTSNQIRTAPTDPVVTSASGATGSSLDFLLATPDDATNLEYRLFRNGWLVATFVNANYTGGSNTTFTDDTGLEYGTEYTYTLVAHDNFNGLSTSSATNSFCTNPGLVLDPRASSLTSTSVEISWRAPSGGITQFDLSWDSPTAAVTTATATLTESDISALQQADDYTLNVTTMFTCPGTAITGGTADQLSDDPVTLEFQTVPGKPNVSVQELDVVSTGTTEIQIEWVKHADDVQQTPAQFKWALFRSVDGISYDAILEDQPYDKLFHFDTGLSPATLYFYKVQSSYYGGLSQKSDPDIGCTHPTPPVSVQINTINDTHLECTWASPTSNGEALSGFEVDFNSNGNPVYVTKDVTSNVTFVGDTEFSPGLVQDGPNTCYVRAVANCSDNIDLLYSSWSTVVGYLAPIEPTLETTPLSEESIQIRAVPDPANTDTEGMTVTILRDGDNAIAVDVPFPWIFVDDIDVQPGKEYQYTAQLKQNGISSSTSQIKLECAKPAPAQSLSAVAINTTSIELFWSMNEGDFDLFALSAKNDLTALQSGVVAATSGDSTYSFVFSGLTAENCFTLEVITVRDCNDTDVASGSATATNHSATAATLSACTRPEAPGLVVGYGDLGEMVITFNITDSAYSYHLWRSSTNVSDPDQYLDTTMEEDGVFSDTFDIVGGYAYCYRGAVENNGVQSLLSPVACSCAIPNPVSELQTTNYTDTSISLLWTNPDGNYSYTQIKFNNQIDNATANANTYDAGYGATPVLALTPNTPYTITATNFIDCSVEDPPDQIPSPPVTIQDATSAPRPVVIVETSPDIPPELTISFYLPDGTSEFSYSLERDGNDVTGPITNPFVDSTVRTAREYNYTGFLIGVNGERSPASQMVTYCTHPAKPTNMLQVGATNSTITVVWEISEVVDGYYLTIDQLSNNLITDTSLNPGQANRVSAFTAASSAGTARDESATLRHVLDGGTASGVLTPATSFQVGFTGCIDCVLATDFAALQADDTVNAVADPREMCSYFSVLNAYTSPDQPTCEVITESMFALQISAVQAALDENAVYFVVYRNGIGLPIANVTSDELPWVDDFQTVPGTEYVYNVYSSFRGWKSVPAVCVGCAKPRPPSNVDGVPRNDSSIYISWDDPDLEGVVEEYEASRGDGSWINVTGSNDWVFQGLSASTCYDFNLRAKTACDNDVNSPNVPVYSSTQTVRRCTKPAPCVITSVAAADIATVDYQSKMEIEIDWLTGHTYKIYRDNELFAQGVTPNIAYYVDDDIQSGAFHCYKCSAVKNGISGVRGTEFCGCSRPGEPTDLAFEALGPTKVMLLWAAPPNNVQFTYFEVKNSAEVTETNITTEYFEWPTALSSSTSYTFYVRTVLTCAGATGGSVDLESDWVPVTAYTAPGTPVLEVVDQSTDYIEINVVDNAIYDSIRLFVDDAELKPSPSAWPYQISDLVPGQSYSFFVTVYLNGLFNTSETIVWCTEPEVPTNLDSITRYFYGFQVRFDPPAQGYTTGFEVWSDVDSVWHMTNTSADDFEEWFYYYNFNVTRDFTRNLIPDEFEGIHVLGFNDLAYEEPRLQVNEIESGSSYTIKVRAFKVCQVVEHGLNATDRTFYSESVLGTATTGAHPVVNIETFPVSQTEIQLTFSLFGQYGDGVKFNIYRYFNGSAAPQAVFTDIALDDLPFQDTGLQPASLYSYEVSVVHLGIEIFDYSRVAMEAELFPGDRANYVDEYANMYNQSEGLWRGFTYEWYHGGVYQPTHVNVYDVSGQHDVETFYYREKTACTYPPNPSSATWHVDPSTHNSTYITWTVDDYSQAQTMTHPVYGSINATIFLYINGILAARLEDDYSTTSYAFEQLENPKTGYTCEVAIGLTCPDEKTFLDVDEYGDYSYRLNRYNGLEVYKFIEYPGVNAPPLTPDVNLMSFDSDSTRERQQVLCYTRPSPITITQFEPGVSDPTTKLRVDYTQPDSGLTYEAKLTTELSESPLSVNTTIESEDTLSFQTIEGLVPGHAYSVEMRSFWQVNANLTIYSLPAPYQYTPELTLLSDNGQTNLYDPVFGCTLPADLNDLEVFGVNNETIGATWTAPDGQSQAFVFQFSPEGTFQYSEEVVPAGTSATVGEAFSREFGEFGSCQTIEVNISVVSTCGTFLPNASTSEILTTYTTPTIPFWVPASCSSDSNSAITLVFEDTNAASCPLVYTVYRDSVESVDADNNGSVKTMTDDEDLLAGTVYQYEVSATAYNQTSPRSTLLQICTKPNPPSSLEVTPTGDTSSYRVSWSAPAVGSATGYYLSDNQGNSDVLVLGTSFKYNGKTPGLEETLSITLKSFLECHVTGVNPVRELVSDTSYTDTITVVTAPLQPLVTKHSSTSTTTFVMEVQIQGGGVISRLSIDSSVALSKEPTSTDASITSLDPSNSNNFILYPDDPTVVDPVFLITVEFPDDGTVIEFEISAIYDGTIGADATSKPAGIGYSYEPPAKLLGLDEAVGVLVIALIVIVVVAVVAAVVVLVVFLILKMKAASAVGAAATSTSAEAPAATQGEPQPRGRLWQDPNPDADYTLTDTYHLRTDYIAAKVYAGPK